ncbi:polysaccharide pyruvyl transferase family protein [Anaerosporobacter sp.]|uniref:polysaccharide pyruvyl transferase family protein n=1 Tax=Anaerosporobacter sp. TaxID=1872529 RepID=UPI00286F616C|nr:polysaccharide pyruvyl transferase family protein [Anaerosporobacter sp.]
MKKALVTSLGARSTLENYGAVLQILAFCSTLKTTYSIDCDVLDYIGINCEGYKDPIIIAQNVFDNSIKGKVKKILLGSPIRKRYIRNLYFMKQEINLTQLYDYKSISDQHFKYDYYIAESDVIWDPTFRRKGFDNIFFLNCPAFENGQKIVYSAGLGDSNFTHSNKQEFLDKIQNLKHWSVRENYSKCYLESFINDEVEATLDPTLLINDNFYRNYIGKQRLVKKDYILVYTPGFKNEKMLEDAYNCAKLKNCKVLIISRCATLKNIADIKVNVDVPEFLTYLFYCKHFFCDSFHGVCLSVVLKKDFYVYEREDGKKISDLCNRLGIDSRIVKDKLDKQPINYDKVYEKLNYEKMRSLSFLDKCFTK